MNTTKCNDNHRSEQLDQMIQTAIQEWRPEHFTRRKDGMMLGEIYLKVVMHSEGECLSEIT